MVKKILAVVLAGVGAVGVAAYLIYKYIYKPPPPPPPPPNRITEIRLRSDKTTYAVGETARLTQGLYDGAGNLIRDRVVDYAVYRNGTWYAGWGQYSDDPDQSLYLNAAGTYVITGSFPGDDEYEPSSKSITITAS